MAESTLEADRGAGAPPASSPPVASSWGPRRLVRRSPGAVTAVGLLVLSVLIVELTNTRPGFDPYGWLVWGHQTIHASLDTNAAPSWKPLPYLFTVPFALLGKYELKLWMFASVAISLSGIVFAGRIAYKLTDAPPERRWAAWAAAGFAGAAVLGIQNYSHYVLSAQSDPMIVALCLGVIDCHLDGRYRWTFVLGVLASLGRPEAWAFLGAWSLWAWRTRPVSRGLLAGGWAAIALLWFGIPALTSRTPFVSASNAMDSGRRLTSNQVGGTISRFFSISELPVELAALLCVGLAIWRRHRVALVLTAGTLSWVVIEIAFALHGWPGLVRYMFEAGGVVIVLAGVAVGWLLSGPARWSAWAGSGGPPRWAGSERSARWGAWAGMAAVVVLIASLVPAAISHLRAEHKDLREQQRRTAEIAALTPVIDRLGGAARVRACGEPLTRLEYQTVLAYTLGFNVNRIGFKYGQAIAHGNPIVLFTPYPTKTGWVVQALHQTSPGCRSLPH